MPFEKGQSGNPKGKARGKQNRATKEAKEWVAKVLNGYFNRGRRTRLSPS